MDWCLAISRGHFFFGAICADGKYEIVLVCYISEAFGDLVRDMRSMKLLAIMLAVSIVLSLTASASCGHHH